MKVISLKFIIIVHIGFKSRMSNFYNDLCHMFIRPARQIYNEHDLGCPLIKSYGIRENFSFYTAKNQQIKTSYFKNKSYSNICVVYLHSFNGSRLESLRYAENMLEKGFNFCSFDFAGCGNSAGEYVTLGCNQKYDILKLLEILQKKYQISRFFLWGRSMGAVSAIKFANMMHQYKHSHNSQKIIVKGLILDSPFCSLNKLAVQIAKKRIMIPQFLIKAVFMMIKSTIEKTADFKVEQLQILEELRDIRCPTLLIASKDDNLIDWHHSEDIYNKLRVRDKTIEYIEGEHCETRNNLTLNKIYSFVSSRSEDYCEPNRNFGLSLSKPYHTGRNPAERQARSLKRYETSRTINDSVTLQPSPQIPKEQIKKILICGVCIPSPTNNKNQIIYGEQNQIQLRKFQKSFKTEKRIVSTQKNIQFIENQNKLREKAKPSFKSPNNQPCIRQQNVSQKQEVRHLNIVNSKIKKKVKINKPVNPIQQQNDNSPTHHINRIQFLHQNNPPKTDNTIYITSAKTIQQMQSRNMNTNEANYINMKLKNINSSTPTTISVAKKNVENDKINSIEKTIMRTDEKVKDKLSPRDIEHARSMVNLTEGNAEKEQRKINPNNNNITRIKNFLV